MKKLLEVKRFHFDDKFTVGELWLDNSPINIYTLEDMVREPSEIKPVSDWKISGETAIPRGTYPIIFDYSQHFNKVLPHILNVEGFEGVRIHTGNDDKDTEGCILVGMTWDGNSDFIGSSKVAFEKLLSFIDGHEIEIKIT